MSLVKSFNFLSATLFCLVLIKQTNSQFELCETKAGTFNATIESVTGCSDGVCNFKMETWVAATILITPKVTSKSLVVEGFAKWSFLNIKLPHVRRDGCVGFKESCPWPANQTRRRLVWFYIPYLWFEVSPTVRFIITNDKQQVVACFESVVNLIK
ncbi:hypothetical protein RF11_12718 [Thelohanellus kitauei]|uniref:MD-2-related lipid-recognition domain-containing protein n=1 Tax=Thelohanellus kitauei TaxID=669202 RepID=A0A0C2JC02_THEKT|nr:hypothetical protein RF11_12718 [Thelohanellus kitauei]